MLDLAVLSGQRIAVAVHVAEAKFEVVDLVVQDFVVSVDSGLHVNEVLAGLGGLSVVLVVKLVQLGNDLLTGRSELLLVHFHG